MESPYFAAMYIVYQFLQILDLEMASNLHIALPFIL